MKVGEYILMFILTGIPLVGFILLLVWAFGSSTNTNKKNYARAVLILGLIGVVLYVLLMITLIPLFTSLFNEFSSGFGGMY